MKKSAKEMIENDEWATCWICEDVFGRKRETLRYCSNCKRGFCEGEHGSLRFKPAKCVVCSHSQD